MVKKGLIILVLVAIVTGGAFAHVPFDLSVGGGGFFGNDFGGGIEGSVDAFLLKIEMSQKMPYLGGGGFVFFDATYGELSLGFFGGSGAMDVKAEDSLGLLGNESYKSDTTVMSLNIGLLGKYPFAITNKLTIFPLLGIDYQIVLNVKIDDAKIDDLDSSSTKSVHFSALWSKTGIGADFSITPKIFLRAEALYGVRFSNKYEKDTVNRFDDMVSLAKTLGPAYGFYRISGEASTLLGHGFTFKLAAGYRF